MSTIVEPKTGSTATTSPLEVDTNWFDKEAERLGESIAKLNGKDIACVVEGLVNGSLDQIYRTREDFRNEVGSFIGILLASYAGAGFLLQQATVAANPIAAWAFFLLAGASFMLVWFLKPLYESRLSAAYDIYVSACIHSTLCFKALGLPLTHQWQRNVLECLGVQGEFSERHKKQGAATQWSWHWEFTAGHGATPGSAEQLVAVWRERSPNLWVKCKSIIETARWVGVALCVFSLLLATAFSFAAPASKQDRGAQGSSTSAD